MRIATLDYLGAPSGSQDGYTMLGSGQVARKAGVRLSTILLDALAAADVAPRAHLRVAGLLSGSIRPQLKFTLRYDERAPATGTPTAMLRLFDGVTGITREDRRTT